MAIELSSNSQKLSMWTSEVSMKPLSMLQKRLKVTCGRTSWMRKRLGPGRDVLKTPPSILRNPCRRTKPTSGLKSSPSSMTLARRRHASVL